MERWSTDGGRRVAVGDIELAVHERGRGDPVVLIHGFPELAFSWRHQLPALDDAGYRAIAYDLRGFGGSSRPDSVEAYRLTELVADLVGLIDVLDADHPVVVGHDWGSIVAWATAVMHRDRVRAVVSLNVPYRGWCCGFPDTSIIRSTLMDRLGYVVGFQDGTAEERFAANPAAWLRAMYTRVAARPDFMSDDEFAVYHQAFVAGGLTAPLNLYRNIDRNAADAAPYAGAAMTVPVQMIAGDSDPILPVGLTEGMERWVADLRVESVAACGHWTQQERPEQVNRLLIGFLDDLTARAG
jgi:pimeloyl-ACP methyl ester carboxylesterase